MQEILGLAINDKFCYMVVELSDGNQYGFNLNVQHGMLIAENIVDKSWEVMVVLGTFVGWKVAKQLPMEVKNLDDWRCFVVQFEKREMNNDSLYTGKKEGETISSQLCRK